MYPSDILINVVKAFYEQSEILKFRKLLFSELPDSSEERNKHRKTDEILRGIYDLFQGIPTEVPPVFFFYQ